MVEGATLYISISLSTSWDMLYLPGVSNETYNVKLYNGDAMWRTKHIAPFFLDGSFLWEDQFTKPDGRIDFAVNVSTFPTTWVVSGFAMSTDFGMAILSVPTLVSS